MYLRSPTLLQFPEPKGDMTDARHPVWWSENGRAIPTNAFLGCFRPKATEDTFYWDSTIVHFVRIVLINKARKVLGAITSFWNRLPTDWFSVALMLNM
ncbi:unnamed protein product [Pieris macdunnoughi]|uniref:Uncharacterized protein n=1 Tax=Pieris macdunnoughi TaxID=345717 RepID=A0A821TSE1_9NEOP|nr:unnamed protein product [Pieris macdunnoughi]